jgi:hypothetical protein
VDVLVVVSAPVHFRAALAGSEDIVARRGRRIGRVFQLLHFLGFRWRSTEDKFIPADARNDGVDEDAEKQAAQQRHEPVEAFETGLRGLGAHGRRGFSFAGEGGKHHGGKVGSSWTVSGPVADDVLRFRHVEQVGAGCGSNWAKLDLYRVTWIAAADVEIGVVA